MIKSALIPVAGHGTRLQPATKSQSKQMLPVGRKPIVQYVVEELLRNGIQEILFISGRNNSSIENHLDHEPELFCFLTTANKHDLLQELDFEPLEAKFFYTRQHSQKGLGDAVLCGESFAGADPFPVALGDFILGLHANSQTVTRLAEIFHAQSASCAIAIEEVPWEQTTLAWWSQRAMSQRVFASSTSLRSPSAPSNLAIAGRYVFSPQIFDMIRRVKSNGHAEIQLTNASQLLWQDGRQVVAVKLPPHEKRYGIGNFPSYFAAFVEFALADPAYVNDFRKKLERLLSKATAT